MSEVKVASTISMMEEMRERDCSIKEKIYDIMFIVEKIKLIVYGFSEKYDLDEVTLDESQRISFLNKRRYMDTEISILSDYVQKLDTMIESINDVELKTDDR